MSHGYPFSLRGVLRGLIAVSVLITSACDHLIAAAVGAPPVAWCVRQVAAVIRDAYRLGRFGPSSDHTDIEHHIVDAEIVD
jgi:hypothetical protein